ncbi:MAG: L-seryl-tRNA(Sec) selenium transferase, partial [Vulcanimicrobiaceae bacterium]
ARRKEVLVSRGELIEIGGEFRLPDVMTASGAKLVEVGTTNRTRLSDYRQAITPRTALILKVHPSNYRIQGFTDAAPVADLAALAARAGIPVAHDVGSGLLDRYPGVPRDEPSVIEALRAGPDLVAFSGDKLLGGPQAGIIVGSAALIARLRSDPLMRALRVDKATLAALGATLRLYLSPQSVTRVPIYAMLAATSDELRARAHALVQRIDSSLRPRVADAESYAGGGSLPGMTIPSVALELAPLEIDAFARRARTGAPSLVGRTEGGRFLIDLRTIPPGRDEDVAAAVERSRTS